MKSFLISGLFLSLLLAGCSSSPVRPSSNSPSAGQAAVLLGSAAGGAAAGNAINDRYGAPIGAAVGAGVGLLLNRGLSSREQQIYDEAFEEGKRQGRLELLRQQNSARAQIDRESGAKGTAQGQPIAHYEGGVVEGVRYGPRDADQSGIKEPRR